MPTLSSQIVKREVASVHDVEEALARQAQHGGDLVTNLLELARVSEERLTHAIAESIGLPAAPSGELPQASERVRRFVPGDIAQRYGLYPLSESAGRLVVAVSEPLPSDVASDLEFSLGLAIDQLATTRIRVQQAVSRDYGMRLDQRAERLLARLSGEPDAAPSSPASLATSPTPRGLAVERTAPLPERRNHPVETRTDAPQPPHDEPQGEHPSEPARPRRTPSVNVDLQTLLRAERRPERQRRRLGPYTAAMAELDLLDAETRDHVVAAFFDFAAQYFEYSALFAVHGDVAEGRDAHGSGAPRAKVLSIGVPLDLPSTLASVVAAEPYRLSRLSASGLDGAFAKDLERRPGPVVLLLPIRVRGRTVLVLYGDHGEIDVDLESVGDVISFAPLVATTFERVILKRKGRASGARNLPTTSFSERDRSRSQRVSLPNRHDRASALASALVDAPLRGTFISTHPEPEPEPKPAPEPEPAPAPPSRPEPSSAPRSEPSLVRPVISVGPSKPVSSTRADPSLPTPPRERVDAPQASARVPLSPLWQSGDSGAPRSRTPIPSSFAPGAPPHVETASAPPMTEAAAETPWAPGPARTLTPVHLPAPPATGSQRPRPSDEPGPVLELTRPRVTPPRAIAALATPNAESTPTDAEPSTQPVESPPAPPVESRPLPPRPTPRSVTPPSTPSARRLELVPEPGSDPQAARDPEVSETELEGADVLLGADIFEEIPESEGAPLAPSSRSIAHSARPLAPPGSSLELQLPTVIVDLAQDIDELVQRLLRGERAAAERLVQIGAAAVPALVGAFPGPITAELRRGVGDGPPRASLCGPLLEVLARIGPRAASVLGVRTNDRNAGVRAWATRLLGEMPCLDAAHAVARRFIDEDPEVRRAALAAARMLQAHSASAGVLAGTLSEMLLESSRKEALVHMVIEAVADLREARTIPALVTLLDTGPADVQRSAHWALVILTRTDYGSNAAVWAQWWRENATRHRIEWLIDALMHENQEIRRAAGDELKSQTKEYFGYYDDLPARERERAQARYREWWETKGKARFT